MLEKYKQDSGWYKDEDGISYQTALGFLGGRLGLCGCGIPEDALNYIAGALQLLADWNDIPREPRFDDNAFKEWRKRVDEYFHNDAGAEYFMWYFLDHHELTEHGGSVPGWLTDDGKDMLTDIRKALAETEGE